jgi:carbamoyl-phosphate synthase small subunit
MDLAKEVTTAETYSWTQGSWTLAGDLPEAKAESELPFHVVAYDFGAKRNILRMLVDRGCRLTVVPAKTSAEEVLKMNPDGIFLSNGPGDPAPCDYAIARLRSSWRPIFRYSASASAISCWRWRAARRP